MSAWLANRYWLGWFIFTLTAFLVPEVYSLVVHRPQGTLSDTIWRLEGERPGVPLNGNVLKWNVFHLFFMSELLFLDVWLFCHFGWGLFR